MKCPCEDDGIERFVTGLLLTGSMLLGVLADRHEAPPADACPDEEPAAMVLEMADGTVATASGTAAPKDVRTAAKLIERAAKPVRGHRQLACELPWRMQASSAGLGRTHG